MDNKKIKKFKSLDIILILFAFFMAGVIFFIDLNIPIGVAVGTAYSFVILYSWLLPSDISAVYAGLVCTLLVILGFVFSDTLPGLSHFDGINRVLSIIVIWVCATLVTIAKKSFTSLEESRDTLEQKVEERTKDLKRNEERFRLMVKEIKDYSVILITPEGFIDNWNEGARRIKGYDSLEVIGQHLSIFYNQEDKNNDKARTLLQAAAKNGRALDEGWRIKKDGTEFWALVSLTAIHNEADEIIGFTKVTKDLTDERRTQDLEKSHAVLEARNKELEQFAFIASHDLQEPLTTVNSFVKVLNDEYASKFDVDGKQYLFFINQAVRRMKRLVNDLLNYSRIGSNRAISDVDCNELIKTIIEKKATLISKKRAIIKIEKLPTLTAYPAEISQLFENLISNALKFQKEDNIPEISISVKEQSLFWQFAISDNGIGIVTGQNQKIFEIFKRLHNRRSFEGTGIGLAVCQKIVELHGGEIWVEGNESSGSIFYFTLPK